MLDFAPILLAANTLHANIVREFTHALIETPPSTSRLPQRLLVSLSKAYAHAEESAIAASEESGEVFAQYKTAFK